MNTSPRMVMSVYPGSSDEALIKLEPRKGEYYIRQEDIEKIIEENSNEIALILLGGVNYYTGQLFDMQKITNLIIKCNYI